MVSSASRMQPEARRRYSSALDMKRPLILRRNSPPRTASECFPSFVIKLRHYRWLSRHPDAPLHRGNPSHDSADALHGGLAKQVGGLVAVEQQTRRHRV